MAQDITDLSQFEFMLGDWGAHIIDFPHDFLAMGLPTSIRAERMEDHNEVIFPLASKLSMHFPARGEGRPAVDLHWQDGGDWQPEIEERYWSAGEEGAKAAPKVGGAGTLLHREDGAFLIQRGSHWGTSQLFPKERMEDFADALKVESPEFDHMQSFTQACLGNGTTRSPFRIGGELTQVLLLGVICQFLDEDLEFDPATKRFAGHAKANELLDGPPPRVGWEEFYEGV